ncbi:MAG TPA: hypothetical protein PKC18_08980, partial [Lacipirellulaceae bacterium]|nr:hypothetical protein [Lacipirellulaceae bacterium]
MNKTTTMALIPPLKCGPEEAIRTPTEALEALRAGAVERVVELSEGVYPLDATLTLGAGDSGTLEQPVVWRAAPGARVGFTGGRAVTGLAPVTDPAVLARLQPEARAHVRVSSLVDCGIADPGRLRSRGFGRPVVPAALELFFRSEPLTLARWPNTGADARIAAAPDDALIDDAHGRQFGRVEAGFFYDSDRPAQWAPTQDMWVHGYWAWDWAN